MTQDENFIIQIAYCDYFLFNEMFQVIKYIFDFIN